MIPGKFIILCGGRSGSTYLQRLLNSDPAVICYDEVFNVSNTGNESFNTFCRTHYPITSWLFLRGKISNFSGNFPLTYLVRKYIQQIFEKGQTHSVGFKLIYDQLLHFYAIKSWLYKNQIPIIHLQRRNPLKAALSLIKAKKSGVYISTSSDSPQDKKIKIQPSEILEQLTRLADEKSKCESVMRNNPSITIYYEDLFENQTGTIQQVVDFLKLESHAFHKPDITKTNPEKISEILENYDEVKAVLTGTAWGEYLD